MLFKVRLAWGQLFIEDCVERTVCGGLRIENRLEVAVGAWADAAEADAGGEGSDGAAGLRQNWRRAPLR